MSSTKEGQSKKSNTAASSIVELKAELYRKQLEYQHQKSVSSLPNEAKYIQGRKPVKKSTIWTKKNAGVQQRKEADEKVHVPTTEQGLLELSRKTLEAKSKLYEKMAATGDNAEDEDGQSLYLVDFEKKYIDKTMYDRDKRQPARVRTEPEVDDTPVYTEPESVSKDDEWVEYVDTLGRSRRCMRKDLPKFQEMDMTMRISSTIVEESQRERQQEQQSAASSGSMYPDLMSDDMKREMLREKWEKEQQEMMDNQDTVYYSNVQFDELRSHGVGYYQFSKDEEERQKELDKLNKLRNETLAARSAKEKVKEKRKALLAARLEKVKQRRIAQGKPVPADKPEEDSDEEIVGPVPPKEEEITRSPSPSAKERRSTIREWDLGKDDLLIPQKPQKPKSWVNPRDKRDEDFAPPAFYYDNKPSSSNSAASTGGNKSYANVPPPPETSSQTSTWTIPPPVITPSQTRVPPPNFNMTPVIDTRLPPPPIPQVPQATIVKEPQAAQLKPLDDSVSREPVKFTIGSLKPSQNISKPNQHHQGVTTPAPQESQGIGTSQAQQTVNDMPRSGDIDAMLKSLRDQVQ